MQVTDIISLVTNVGFPVTLCFILIRYVLQTMGEKMEKIDHSLDQLAKEIKAIEHEEK